MFYSITMLFVFFLSFFITSPSNAQIQLTGEAIIGDFYYDASLFIDNKALEIPPDDYAMLKKEQIDRFTKGEIFVAQVAINLLEEARYIFSAMIYGFSFDYVPGDQRRSVKEQFSLKPQGKITIGDPRLEIIEEHIKGDIFYARIRYYLDEQQMNSFKKRSLSAMVKRSSYGYGRLVDNFTGRLEAVEMSAKGAIRAQGRHLYRAKPRRMKGEIFIDRVRKISVEHGEFRAYGSFFFHLDEVDHHYLY